MSTQKQPKVAVITRTKNRNILLERALKSVHQQTMEDFVHIIYNDSGDEAAVEMLLEKYKDITIINVAHKGNSLNFCDKVYLLKNNKLQKVKK